MGRGLAMISLTLSLCAARALGAAAPAAVVVHPGASAWAAAATSGRADLLILGDSVVWHQGHGWDAGFNRAAHDTFGLAGTGLGSGLGSGQGEGYANYGTHNPGWSTSPSSVPAAGAGYNWLLPATAGSAPASHYGWGIDGTTLPRAAAYDWHLYTASPAGNGSMAAYRRDGVPPYQTSVTKAAVATSGLQHTTFHFGPTSSSLAQEFFLRDVTNTSVLYDRMVRPGAAGLTVTSWGYGGRSARQFLAEQYARPEFTPAGRAAWLDAIVDGGSGKLNVVIAEGLNDRNDAATSADGVNKSNTAAGFKSNIEALIDGVRDDWQAAGNDADDLVFTLLGMYPTADEPGPDGKLREFAAAEAEIAAADPLVNFVDLYQVGPTYAEALAAGYYYDPANGDTTHLSRAGALHYSRLAMDAIIPEPGSLGVLACVALALCRRRVRATRSRRDPAV